MSIKGLGLNVNKGVRMPIYYPGRDEPMKDKDGKEAYLELLSEDSEPGRAFERKLTNRAVQRATQGRRGRFDEDPVEFQVDKTTALLVGWYLVSPDGTPITDFEFSPERARELMSDPSYAWLRKQAMAFINDNSNFTRPSSLN